MKHRYLVSLVALALAVSACGHKPVDAADSLTEPLHATVEGVADTIGSAYSPIEKPLPKSRMAVSTAQPKATPPTKRVKESPTGRPSAKAPAIRETLYVESEDARGRVWGHVAMQGDRGHGTIHDEGENTYTVTVTRHDDELFAVDQNSRQYVFKLKKER